MELGKILEQDIENFLDEKQAQMTEGILKNIERLKQSMNQKPEKIKELLELSIQEYNGINKKDPYKKIAFSKLKSAVLTINEEEKLKDYPILKDALEEQVATQEEPPEKIKLSAESMEYKNLSKQKENIEKTKQELLGLIRKKDVKEGIMTYRRLKEQFRDLKEDRTDYKKQLYTDILSYYLQLKKILKEKKKPPTESIIRSQTNIERHTIDLQKLEMLITETDKLAKEGQYDEATTRVLDIKRDIEKIPDNRETLREELEKKANHILTQISMLKKMTRQKSEA